MGKLSTNLSQKVNVYINFTGELDFPEGQDPNEPNRDEEEEIEEELDSIKISNDDT